LTERFFLKKKQTNLAHMILVTGGTGLVGAHLLYHLTQKEVKVRALRRSQTSVSQTKSLFLLYFPT